MNKHREHRTYISLLYPVTVGRHRPNVNTINEENSGIFNAHLIVAGGDIDNSSTVKTAFSLLSKNRMILQTIDDRDVMYLCHLLMNRTIVLQSVTKNLSDDDESDGKIVEIMNMI